MTSGHLWLRLSDWALPMLSGLLLALSFPPFDFTGLVWIALVPLLGSLHLFGASGISGLRRFRRGFARGYLCGLVYFGVSLSWLAEVVADGVGWWMLPVPTGAVSLFLSLYPAVWAGLVAALANPLSQAGRAGSAAGTSLQRKVQARLAAEKLDRRSLGDRLALGDALTSFRCALLGASLWVVMEWLRGWVLTGFGWNSLGTAFHESLYLAQAADLVGEVGLAFLPVFTGCVIFDVARRLVEEVRRGRFRAHLDFALAVALIAACFFYGAARLEQVRSWESTPVRILAIQRNLPLDLETVGMESKDLFPHYLGATEEALKEIEESQREAIREGGEVELWYPDWVIWPESALYFPLWRDADGELSEERQWNVAYYRQGIRPLQEKYGPFTWMTGVNESVARGGEEIDSYNSLWVVKEGVRDSRNWGKRHLVPFGEYIPLKDTFPFLQQLFEAASGGNPYGGDFQRGRNARALPVDLGGRSIGVIGAICYEDSVPRVLRPFVEAGKPQVIVNVTNDGWFGESAAPYQHFAKARFRAIEFRRPLVRAANTGITVAVGVDGSVFDAQHPEEGARWLMDPVHGPFKSGYLKATIEVPEAGPLTLYAAFGNWFVGFCGALALVLAVPAFIKKIR